MGKTTKKFNKAVAALTKELASPAPRTRKVIKMLTKPKSKVIYCDFPEEMQEVRYVQYTSLQRAAEVKPAKSARTVIKVNKILSTLKKHLTAGIDPEAQVYFALRTAWDANYESLPAVTAEELRDIAFTYSKALRAVTYRNLVTESLSNSPDPDILDCNYDLLIDLTCECYETEGNEDCTPWGNTLNPEEIAVFMSLPAPEGGTAKDDREVLAERCLVWLSNGAVSRKFEILE